MYCVTFETVGKCFFCGKDTHLYVGDAPVCVQCSDLLDAGKKPPQRETANDPKSIDKDRRTGSR